mmetsp:Transcript_26985/g.84359  ORF Transcript_26985/g.84359 Transcript_26985/m.84359 type:complete len:272 (+) Transcript_26985:591-1406(+)
MGGPATVALSARGPHACCCGRSGARSWWHRPGRAAFCAGVLGFRPLGPCLGGPHRAPAAHPQAVCSGGRTGTALPAGRPQRWGRGPSERGGDGMARALARRPLAAPARHDHGAQRRRGRCRRWPPGGRRGLPGAAAVRAHGGSGAGLSREGLAVVCTDPALRLRRRSLPPRSSSQARPLRRSGQGALAAPGATDGAAAARCLAEQPAGAECTLVLAREGGPEGSWGHVPACLCASACLCVPACLLACCWPVHARSSLWTLAAGLFHRARQA